MINFKEETLMGSSKAIVFPKRAGGWCEPVKNAFESTPELHGEKKPLPVLMPLCDEEDWLMPINQGGNAGSSRPFTKGWGLFLLSFFM